MIRYSRQRELIKEKVMSSKEHPTAEMVYAEVKLKMPSISLATVYRNLNSLVEMGAIRRLSMPDGPDRFDGWKGRHYHMVCDSCGCVVDVKSDALREMDRMLEQQYGFQVRDHDLLVYGVCKQCMHNQNIKEERGKTNEGIKRI